MIIKFKNWEKYQGRSDVKHCFWFRLNNDFLSDSKMFNLSINEIYAMIYLLCEASKQNKSGEAMINEIHAQQSSRVCSQVLHQTIKKLKQLRVLEVRTLRGRYVSDTDLCATDITNKQTGQDTVSIETKTNPIFEIWNQHRGNLPLARGFSASRLKTAIARWKEKPDRDYWIDVVKILSESKFCNGVNERDWKADFDFLLKPDTHLRAIEGKYGSFKNNHSENETQRVIPNPAELIIESLK